MALKPRKYVRKRVPDGLVAHSKPLTQQIEAVSASFGYDQFVRLQRCKLLKAIRLPAILRLVSKQIDSYHFDPVYGSMT